MALVSIVIPVYNERLYIDQVLKRTMTVLFPGCDKEIIVVDDCSTDGTDQVLAPWSSRCIIIRHQRNRGKGAALRTGFEHCSGDIIAIQDADWEYQPKDLVPLVAAVNSGQTLVAYGSRLIAQNPVGHFFYYWGNKVISLLTTVLYGVWLTDVETGHKVFKRSALAGLALEQNDFGFEIEVTAKLLRRGIHIVELPTSYAPRKFSQGKKINWRDGVKAIWLLIKYRFR